jgi:ABC-type phosphate transport system auxiliary subunit
MARRGKLLGSAALTRFFGSASPWVLVAAGAVLAVALLSTPGSKPNKASNAVLRMLPGVKAIEAVKRLLQGRQPVADLRRSGDVPRAV